MLKKLIFLISLLTLAFIFAARQAEAESASPTDVYRHYLNRIYYAKNLKAVAPYFVERTRQYYEGLEGQAMLEELKKLKRSYVYKFVPTKEEKVGDMYYILGNGIAMDHGKRVNCEVRVELVLETAGWKIRMHCWKGKMRMPKG